MKMFMMSCLLALTTITLSAQSPADLAAVETTVLDFAHLADRQDAAGLDRLLHPHYRTVANRLFGSSDASLMDKSLYLQLIRDKKIGGDERQVHLLSVDIVNHNASVKAVFEGKALRFVTFLSLVRLPDGTWQVIGDFPDITAKGS